MTQDEIDKMNELLELFMDNIINLEEDIEILESLLIMTKRKIEGKRYDTTTNTQTSRHTSTEVLPLSILSLSMSGIHL